MNSPALASWPEPALRLLSDWRWVGGASLLYATLHAAIRFVLSPTLGYDDAEQALFAQTFAGGYGFAQPPLYTWILITANGVFGHGLASHVFIRLGLQFLFLLFTWLAARRLCGDPRIASLATFSYLFFYVFSFYWHHDLTHTTLLAVSIAASVHFYLRAAEKGCTVDFVFLGVAVGVGFLAKYSFAVLALAGVFAVLSLPKVRKRIFRPQMLLTLLVAVLVISPHLFWLASHGHDPIAGTVSVFRPSPDGGGLLVAPGIVLLKTVEYLAPFVILSACTIPALFRVWSPSKDDSFEHRRVLARTIAIGFVVVLVAATAMEATHLKARWLHVPFLLLPLVLFAAFPEPPSWKRGRNFLAVLAIVCLFAVVARFAVDSLAPSRCGNCRAYLPVASFAGMLEERGFRRGTIIASEHDIAGNLKVHFPTARVLSSRNPSWVGLDFSTGGACLMLWRLGQEGIDPVLETLLLTALGQDALPPTEMLSAPLIGAPEREFSLAYVLIPGAGDACAQVWSDFLAERGRMP